MRKLLDTALYRKAARTLGDVASTCAASVSPRLFGSNLVRSAVQFGAGAALGCVDNRVCQTLAAEMQVNAVDTGISAAGAAVLDFALPPRQPRGLAGARVTAPSE